MKRIFAPLLLLAALSVISACTTDQQARLVSATETAALTALHAKARGASSSTAANSGMIAGILAYKTPPTVPSQPVTVEETASK